MLRCLVDVDDLGSYFAPTLPAPPPLLMPPIISKKDTGPQFTEENLVRMKALFDAIGSTDGEPVQNITASIIIIW